MEAFPRSRPYSAEELLRLPHGMGESYELIEGELMVREPPGVHHGAITANVSHLLKAFNETRRLGRVLAGDPGFFSRGDERTVRGPDVAFLSYRRWPAHEGLPEGYGVVAPELAVEVLSPSDRPADVAAKTREWLAFGSGRCGRSIPGVAACG